MRKIVKGTSPNDDKDLCIFEVVAGKFRCYSIDRKYFSLTRDQMQTFRKKREQHHIFLSKRILGTMI